MSEHEFEQLLSEALIQSCQETWIDHPSEDELNQELLDTGTLDERVKRSLAALKAAPVKLPSQSVYKRMGRYAAMFFLSISILFGAVMLNPEARAYIINLVTTWYEDYDAYSFYEESDIGIAGNWEFAYIPDGFQLYYEHEGDTYCTYKYEHTSGALLDITITNESGTNNVDHEHYIVESATIRGVHADIYSSQSADWPNMIVWYREDLGALVKISGDIAIEELVLILENMYP